MKEYHIAKKTTLLNTELFTEKLSVDSSGKTLTTPVPENLENTKIILDSSESRVPPPRLSENCLFLYFAFGFLYFLKGLAGFLREWCISGWPRWASEKEH